MILLPMKRVMKTILCRIKDCVLPNHKLDEAQECLAKLILKGSPLMVARFGAVEIKGVLYKYLPRPFFLKKIIPTNTCMFVRVFTR